MSHEHHGLVGSDDDDERRKDAFVLASAMAGAESVDRSVPSPTHLSREDVYFHAPSYDHYEPKTTRPRAKSSIITPTRKATKPATLKDRGVSGGIPHVYHDYSQVPDVLDFSRKKTGGVTQPFPEKLHEMLNAVEGTADCDIVSWLTHGRAFIVHKPRDFTERIMPRQV